MTSAAPEPGTPKLKPIWLNITIAAVFAQAFGLTLLLLWDMVKIALTVVAGIGGLVALVVAYRRQKVTEAAAPCDWAARLAPVGLVKVEAGDAP